MSLTLGASSRERNEERLGPLDSSPYTLITAYLYLPAPPDGVPKDGATHEQGGSGRGQSPDPRTTALGEALLCGLFDHRCPFLHFFLRAFTGLLQLLSSLLQVLLGLLLGLLSLRRFHVLLRLRNPFLRLLLSLLQLLQVLPLRCGGRRDYYRTHQTVLTRAATTKYITLGIGLFSFYHTVV